MLYIAITGAGTGLGRSLALRYAKEGHFIYLLGRSEEKLLLAKKEIQAAGGKAFDCVCDITEQASVTEAIKQMERLDILINNAGVGIFGALHKYKEKEIDDMLQTNVKGTILMTQAALPLIQQTKGRILNIISTAGLRGKVNESVYCASKFAQRGFTESLQKEYEHQPIAITAVYMGGMNTPFWNNSSHVDNPSRLKSPDTVADEIYQQDDGRLEIHINKK